MPSVVKSNGIVPLGECHVKKGLEFWDLFLTHQADNGLNRATLNLFHMAVFN